MGFRGPKLEALLALAPDLAIVQECSERDAGALAADGFDVIWEGSNPGKGLGVVARPGVSVSLDACHDPELAYFLPLRISSRELDFRLIAVWAFNQRPSHARGLTQRLALRTRQGARRGRMRHLPLVPARRQAVSHRLLLRLVGHRGQPCRDRRTGKVARPQRSQSDRR